jgi:hypothetical protein
MTEKRAQFCRRNKAIRSVVLGKTIRSVTQWRQKRAELRAAWDCVPSERRPSRASSSNNAARRLPWWPITLAIQLSADFLGTFSNVLFRGKSGRDN